MASFTKTLSFHITKELRNLSVIWILTPLVFVHECSAQHKLASYHLPATCPAPVKGYQVVGILRGKELCSLKQKIEMCEKIKWFKQNYVDEGLQCWVLHAVPHTKTKRQTFQFCSQTMEKCFTLKEAKFQELDKVLNEWFLARWAKGCAVTGLLFLKKTKHFYELMELKEHGI